MSHFLGGIREDLNEFDMSVDRRSHLSEVA
jgi:hypothetical protein